MVLLFERGSHVVLAFLVLAVLIKGIFTLKTKIWRVLTGDFVCVT